MAKKRSGPAHEPTPGRSEVPDRVLRDLVGTVRLLADETRLRILLDLAQHGERNVGDLCARVGMNQPAMSHHLALLRVAGLVVTRRAGKHQFYGVHPEVLGDLLARVLAATGRGARKVRFGDFTLTYQGE